jgi:hypothetical protein
MKTPDSNPAPDDKDDLAAEYTFDYTKAKSNRFATAKTQASRRVVVDLLKLLQKLM